jgi:two-component system sensor histidine kinase DesK
MDRNGVRLAEPETEWVAYQRKWARGWRRIVFPGIFLVYLVEPATAIAKYSSGPLAVVGYALLVAFCVCYLFALPGSWVDETPHRWARLGTMVALFAAVIPLAHADAFVMCVFIVVIAVAWFGAKAAPLTLVFTALAVVLPAAVPSWHQSYATSLDNGNAIAIPMVALAMFGFFNVLHGNRALAEARSEIARLAAENERTRIARDLHDLLGHSLTTITVKAELSRRLGQTDVAAALREIGEVEVLSRRALSDVRAAVANYRDVTLVGELASGRELLRAAGIAADLPRAVDVVDDGAQELFGWVLREGLTNVVRHSHASLCTVRISKTSVEIVDDGSGMLVAAGSGLSGLRERVGAAGGTMEVGPVPPRGWRIAVRLSGADAGHLA